MRLWMLVVVIIATVLITAMVVKYLSPLAFGAGAVLLWGAIEYRSTRHLTALFEED